MVKAIGESPYMSALHNGRCNQHWMREMPLATVAGSAFDRVGIPGWNGACVRSIMQMPSATTALSIRF